MRVITGAEEAAASTAALDPTLLALLSIFGGALLTAAAGFWGAWRQSKREHERWVRERRYEAYREFAAISRVFVDHRGISNDLRKKIVKVTSKRDELMERLRTVTDVRDADEVKAEVAKLDESVDRLSQEADEAFTTLHKVSREAIERIAPFHLLGPKAVTTAAAALGDAIAERNADHDAALRKLEAEMRAALDIKDY